MLRLAFTDATISGAWREKRRHAAMSGAAVSAP
jgi:hypothetical protein